MSSRAGGGHRSTRTRKKRGGVFRLARRTRRRLRRSWRRLSRYERRRRLKVTAFFVGLGLLVFLGFCVVDALAAVTSAETTLDEARTNIASITASPHQLLSAAGRAQVAGELTAVQSDASAAADRLTGSLGVSVLGFLPYLHTQRQAAVQLVDDLDTTATSGRTLLTTLDRLVADTHGTSVDLADLRTLGRQVDSAEHTQAGLVRPSGGLLGTLSRARQKFDAEDGRLVGLLAQGRQLIDYALPFLGADGPRTYLLVAENNAEMRDQGAVLSYAVMTTDQGTYTVDDDHPIADAQLDAPADVPTPPGLEQVFGAYQPTLLWQSTNATAGFPWSGLDMQTMYAQAAGQHVDGVIGIDVPMLRRMLALTGPVRVAGIPVPVTAANVTSLLLHDLYQGLEPGPQTPHNDQLAAVARAVVDRLKGGHIDLAALANALAKGVAARDLLAWDEVPAYEATIARFGGSGAVDRVHPDRTFHVAVENGTATKLDYYVHVDVDLQVDLTEFGTAVVHTTVTVVNTAPAHAAPSYQLGPDGIASSVAGQYVGHVYLWGPRGSEEIGGVSESGLNLIEQDVSVLGGQSASVTFLTVIPGAVAHGQLLLSLVPQPRLTPERYTVSVSAPDWVVTGPPTQLVNLADTKVLTWGITR